MTVGRLLRIATVLGAALLVTAAPTTVGSQEPGVPTATVETIVRSVGVVSSGLRMGTGWLAGPEVVITNFHVSRAAQTDVRFTPSDGEPVTCWVAAADRDADLAALRCPVLDRPVLPIARRPALLDEPVVVVGYPGGVGPTITAGTVVELEQLIRAVHTLRFTAEIAPGSSGSPVVGADGQVLAVATFAGGYGSKADKLREIVERARAAEPTRGRQALVDWLTRSGVLGGALGAIGAYTGWRSGTGAGRRRGIGWAVAGIGAVTAWTILQFVLDGPTSMVT